MEEIRINGSCQGRITTHLQQKILQEYEKGAEFYIVDIEATSHLLVPKEASNLAKENLSDE